MGSQKVSTLLFKHDHVLTGSEQLLGQEENWNLARTGGLKISVWIFEYISINDFPNVHTHIAWTELYFHK